MKRAKITRSFDIDAAVEDTIYGTRGRIKSACLLLACSDQILYYDRYILLWILYNIRGFAKLGCGPLIGIFCTPVIALPSLVV